MSEAIEAKPEFRSLAEDAVVAALQDSDPGNPIAAEICPPHGRVHSGHRGHKTALAY
jgi:hypothetical protein